MRTLGPRSPMCTKSKVPKPETTEPSVRAGQTSLPQTRDPFRNARPAKQQTLQHTKHKTNSMHPCESRGMVLFEPRPLTCSTCLPVERNQKLTPKWGASIESLPLYPPAKITSKAARGSLATHLWQRSSKLPPTGQCQTCNPDCPDTQNRRTSEPCPIA